MFGHRLGLRENNVLWECMDRRSSQCAIVCLVICAPVTCAFLSGAMLYWEAVSQPIWPSQQGTSERQCRLHHYMAPGSPVVWSPQGNLDQGRSIPVKMDALLSFSLKRMPMCHRAKTFTLCSLSSFSLKLHSE